eukprot:364997-Chlamydomonas_euryale.AAC.6
MGHLRRPCTPGRRNFRAPKFDEHGRARAFAIGLPSRSFCLSIPLCLVPGKDVIRRSARGLLLSTCVASVLPARATTSSTPTARFRTAELVGGSPTPTPLRDGVCGRRGATKSSVAPRRATELRRRTSGQHDTDAISAARRVVTDAGRRRATSNREQRKGRGAGDKGVVV